MPIDFDESTDDGLNENLAKLLEELVSRGYRRELVASAIDRVRQLDRNLALQKVPRPTNDRPVLTVPYHPRLPAVAPLVAHRHKCLLDRDLEAPEYLPEPPLVGYIRPKNVREWLVRAALPPPPRARPLRAGRGGFRPCNRRANCALCYHSPGAMNSYVCPVTASKVEIRQNITCTDVGIYIILCSKDSGACSTLHPSYIGESGDGVLSSFTHRLSSHLASATNASQEDSVKPVGRHYRLPGHNPNQHLIMLQLKRLKIPSSVRLGRPFTLENSKPPRGSQSQK